MRDDGYFYSAFKVYHFQCRVFNVILEASLGCSLVEKNLVSVRDTRTCLADIHFFAVLSIPEIDDRTFISSPGYPTSYSENTYCYWEVDVPYDVEVILEFNPRW